MLQNRHGVRQLTIINFNKSHTDVTTTLTTFPAVHK